MELLNSDKSAFFLHLLGQDTIGHAQKPHSNDYHSNLEHVDRRIQEVVELVEDFYQDGLSAFVVSSDHGMNMFGAHGEGDPIQTRIPMVAWGAGIRGPEPGDVTAKAGEDNNNKVVVGEESNNNSDPSSNNRKTKRAV